MRHKYHLTISIAVFLTSGLWGLYWIPQRALQNGGLTGGWGTVAQYLIPLIVLTPSSAGKTGNLGMFIF